MAHSTGSFASLVLLLDPTVTPKTIDFVPGAGMDRSRTLPGIYELKELTLCLAGAGDGRPIRFESRGTGEVTLEKWKRTMR